MTSREEDEGGMPPEVERFLEAKRKIEEFKEANPEVFEELAELTEEYNTALEAASSAVRSTMSSFGPFIREKIVVKYDGDKLYDAVGHKDFAKHGGVMTTVTKYSVNKETFEAQVASGVIPSALADEVKNVIPHYKRIDKLVIP